MKRYRNCGKFGANYSYFSLDFHARASDTADSILVFENGRCRRYDVVRVNPYHVALEPSDDTISREMIEMDLNGCA